ncbi:peptide chain release factor aRF-1 [Candidatus Woesearchaeota archaeon]|nr:peptide chain release factor aRF-1 [Candidatus Woesearchaeota archaeon]
MADMTEMQKYHLKKFVKELGKHRGRHTELVSVYIPAGYDLNLINKHLSEEQGTASNIKSKQTREHVLGALEKMLQHLKLFKRTPPNGLAVFSGNVAEKEGQTDIKVWSVEPPVPLKFRTYRCDKEFVLDPLREMMESKEVYGLVVLDRRDAMLALLKGKTIIPIRKTHSEVPGKMKAGGQSAARFARLREGAAKDHYKKVAEYMKEEFLKLEGLKGIIIGGPGVTVNDFMGHDYLTGDLKKKIIGTKDLSYTEEFGLQELLEKSEDLLAAEEVAQEKKLVSRFLTLLATKPGIVSYGKDQVMKVLKMGTVDTLLLSETLDENEIEEFEKEAENRGTAVNIISVETREGVQLRDLGMVAAILRYEISTE